MKNVMQADMTGKYKGKSSMQILRMLYQINGMRSLYRGFGPGAGKGADFNRLNIRAAILFTVK